MAEELVVLLGQTMSTIVKDLAVEHLIFASAVQALIIELLSLVVAEAVREYRWVAPVVEALV
jgi:hypothetical protein